MGEEAFPISYKIMQIKKIIGQRFLEIVVLQ